MKRLVKCLVVLVLLTSFFTLAGGTLAHAAPRSVHKVKSCGTNNSARVNIYDTRGTGNYLGYLIIDVNGCGDARGTINTASNNYHINHLWVRDSNLNNVSSDFGYGQTYEADTSWWSVSTSCAIVSGVIQYGSEWGNANTPCLNVN